jgi:hypothetical protein
VKLPASAIVLVLLGSACHNSTDQVSTPFVPAPADRTPVVVTLSGMVTDGTSGTPIAGARVSLPDSYSFRSTFGSTTDAAGHYRISSLPDGLQYWVTASTMGYVQPCAAQLTLHGDTTVNLQLVPAAALSASSNAGVSRVPGTRNAAGFVYRVTADGKQPVPGVFVGFDALSDIGFSPLDVSTTISDSTGHYALCGLPMNETIYLEAFFGTVSGGGTASVSAGTTDAVADITLGQ